MITRIYRLNRHATLYAFGDPIGQVPIVGYPLSGWQEMAVAKLGLLLVDVDDEALIVDAAYLIFDQALFFTVEFLRSVLDLAPLQEQSCQFCLAHNRFNARFVLPTGLTDDHLHKFNFYYQIKNRPVCHPVVVPQHIFANAGMPLPPQILNGDVYHCDQCDTFASSLISPFHLLQTNLAMLFYGKLSIRRYMPDWIMKHFFSPYSRGWYRGLRLQNKIGQRCRIHPTAVLEGVEIGDDVRIGAHVVVRMAKINHGSTLEDHSSVCYSVLGPRNFIANKNHLTFCMSYEDVFLIHGPYQFSIFGRQSAAFAVINCDIRLDQQTITIPTGEGYLDSGQPFLGIAYGHGAKVGGGNIIAPGRIVPNGCQLPPPPTMVVKFEGIEHT